MRHVLSILVLAMLVACSADPSPTPIPPAANSESPAAIGSPDSTALPTPPPSTVAADGIFQIVLGEATGPRLEVAEAIAYTGSDLIMVSGALVISADGILLCQALAESSPPQCGTPRIEVRGLDISQVPDLQSAGDVRWTEQVELIGEMGDD